MIGQHGRHPLDAKFGRLLDHEIHAFAPRDSLHEVRAKLRLRIVLNLLADTEQNIVLADTADPR